MDVAALHTNSWVIVSVIVARINSDLQTSRYNNRSVADCIPTVKQEISAIERSPFYNVDACALAAL